MKCSNCNARIPNDVDFCPKCGVPLLVEEAAVLPPPIPSEHRFPWPYVIAGLVVSTLLILAGLYYTFWRPHHPTFQEVALSLDENTVVQGDFFPDGPIYLLVRHDDLLPGDRITVRWFYRGCTGEEVLAETTREIRSHWPFARTTVLSLTGSLTIPLPIGDYRAEVFLESSKATDTMLTALPFQVLPPPGAIPSRVLEVTPAWLVDADGRPLYRTTTFAPHDVVYLSVQADMGLYSRLEVEWYMEEVVLPGATTVLTSTANQEETTLLAPLALQVPLKEGSYRASLCLDDERVADVEVAVQANPPRPAGTLQETFDDPDSGIWEEGESDTVSFLYKEGGYSIQVHRPEWIGWSDTGEETFQDVAVNVTAWWAGGPEDNDYGIICRLMDDDNFYSLDISSDLSVSIWKRQDGGWMPLVDWTPAPAGIRSGRSPNRITALCLGEELSLRVNGVLLTRIRDDSFAEGAVGIFAASGDEGGVEILFDNLEVTPIR